MHLALQAVAAAAVDSRSSFANAAAPASGVWVYSVILFLMKNSNASTRNRACMGRSASMSVMLSTVFYGATGGGCPPHLVSPRSHKYVWEDRKRNPIHIDVGILRAHALRARVQDPCHGTPARVG